jgi:hypothetical protein
LADIVARKRKERFEGVENYDGKIITEIETRRRRKFADSKIFINP